MSPGEIAIRLAATIWLGWIPAAILFSSGPPQRGSRWYPAPDAWFYGIKLLMYAFVDANSPNDRIGWWFARGVAAIVLSAMLALLWLTPF